MMMLLTVIVSSGVKPSSKIGQRTGRFDTGSYRISEGLTLGPTT